MKKILLFMLLLLIPFMVKAETNHFALSFTTEDDVFSFETIEYNDGYLVSDYNGTEGFLKYYDKEGTKVKEVSLGTNRLAPNMFIIDGELYVLTCEKGGGAAHVLKYDEELNVIKDLNLNRPFFDDPLFSAYLSFVENVGDNISIWYRWESKLLVVNKDLETIQLLDATSANRAIYAPGLLKRNNLYNNSTYYPSVIAGAEFTFDLNNYYMGVYATKVCDSDNIIYMWQTGDDNSVLFEDCYNISFDVYDSDMNKMWGKDLTGIESIYTAKVVGDYLVVVTSSKDRYVALIYDLEGNLLQSIENDRHLIFSYINEIENGFAITERCGVINGNFSTTCTSRHFIYLLNNEIESSTEGKGTVTVPTDAKVGDIVTIEVKPEKGYVLGELIVIDDAGNKLPVTNNTFVMGTSKVTVRAIFVPENPKTGNFYVILIGLIATITGILLVVQKKKLDFLK